MTARSMTPYIEIKPNPNLISSLVYALDSTEFGANGEKFTLESMSYIYIHITVLYIL